MTYGVVHELDADLSHTTTGACKTVHHQHRALSSHFFFPCSSGRCGQRVRASLGCVCGLTGAAEHAGDLDELDGDLSGFHFFDCVGELGSWEGRKVWLSGSVAAAKGVVSSFGVLFRILRAAACIISEKRAAPPNHPIVPGPYLPRTLHNGSFLCDRCEES